MNIKRLWLIGIVISILLILISYLGYSTFNEGVKECGSGEKWPLFFKTILAVCLETIIPNPITKPALYTGVLLLVISIRINNKQS